MVKYNTTSMLLLHMQDLNSLTRYKYFYINTHRLKEGDLTATYRINRPPKGRHDEPAKRQRKRPRARKVMCLLVSRYHVATSVVILRLCDLALEVRRLRRLIKIMFKNELIFETSFKKYISSNGARSFPGNASFRGILHRKRDCVATGKL